MQTVRSPEQERVVLARLSSAGDGGMSVSALAPAKPLKPFQAAGLGGRADVQAVVEELVAAGLVTSKKDGRAVRYSVTPAGESHLASLPVPTARTRTPRNRDPAVEPAPLPGNPNLLPYQQAFLLMQLLCADDRTMTEGQANKLPLVAKQDLELSGPLASQLRRKLAADGYLTQRKEGRSLLVTLTDKGVGYLTTLEHHPAARFTVTGGAINALLAARGDGAGYRVSDVASESEVPADLASVAYRVFQQLARERFTRNGLVPIFEIRREIARQYGPDAARHDTLDHSILSLWRDGRVRLVSISDTRGASAAELEDSITDAYETLFYMEGADGHAGNR